MNESAVMGLHLADAILCQATARRAGRNIELTLHESTVSQQAPADPSFNGALRVACLSAQAVISRRWSFPKADDQTLRRMVANRLEADIPLPMDKLVWDCRPHTAATSDGTVSVIIQAARTDLVARHMVALVSAGHSVNILTTEAEAIQALYRYGLKHERAAGPEALVLADTKGWLVALLTDGSIRSVRRLASQPRPDLAARECARALDTQGPAQPPQQIWWLAHPDLTAAKDCLAEHTNIPIVVAEPSVNLQSSSGQLAPESFADYAIAIGLSLAGLLEPDQVIRLAGQREEKASPRSNRLEDLLARPTHLAILAAGLTLLAIILHVGALHIESAKMRKVLAQADQPAAGKGFQSKLQAMQRLQTYRVDIEKVFAELGQVMPDTIMISSAQFSRESRMVIKGTAKDPKAVFALAEALRKSKRFQDVNWDRAEPGQGGTFTISMEVAGMNSLNAQRQGGARWR